METTNEERPSEGFRTKRTCVGCGLRDDAGAMARATLAGTEVVFDAPFHSGAETAGRGAHVHPRSSCLVKAPRGMARAFKASVQTDTARLGRSLIAASETAMARLLRAARRNGTVSIGVDPTAALSIVASDAFDPRRVWEHGGLERMVRDGRAIAWKTKRELGALLGEEAVAICAVRHVRIATLLIRLRAAVDAGLAVARATNEGAECSRCPEAR